MVQLQRLSVMLLNKFFATFKNLRFHKYSTVSERSSNLLSSALSTFVNWESCTGKNISLLLLIEKSCRFLSSLISFGKI